MGFRRKNSRKIEEEAKEAARDEFKSKLNLMLRTPQGIEIQKRNWRVSDKFMGGQPMDDFRAAKNRQRVLEDEEEELLRSRKHRGKDLLEEFSGENKRRPSKKN